MSGPVTLARFARDRFAALGRAWSQVWFQDRPTSPLELARMGVGAALLVNYGLRTPCIFFVWGDQGWMPRVAPQRDDRSMVAIDFLFILRRSVAVGCLSGRVFALLRRLDAGVADVMGKVDRAGSASFPTPIAIHC